MRDSRKIKSEFKDSLSLICDDVLAGYGFKRRKGSLNYVRTVNGIFQTLAFNISCHPKYQPGAELHIQPHVLLAIHSVSDVALELVGGNGFLLANAPDVIVNQPIEFVAPKGTFPRLFANNGSEVDNQLLRTLDFVKSWVIPFFDDLDTIEGLIHMYEVGDRRMMRQRHWHIFIAAAFIVLGRKEDAKKVLENNFSDPGIRSRYSVVFDKIRD